MSRALGVVGVWFLSVALAGCFGKYRHPEEYAVNTFSEEFSCPDERSHARQSGTVWVVEGCNKLASCDIVGGQWHCTETELAYHRAWKDVSSRTDCPKENVIPKQQTQLNPGETRIRIDACGALWTCTVIDLGAVTCDPVGGGSSAGAASLSPPPPPPPPPPVSGASGASADCTPKCRSGYVCKAGACVASCTPACKSGTVCVNRACVSACNPPCAKGEHCLDSGECASGP